MKTRAVVRDLLVGIVREVLDHPRFRRHHCQNYRPFNHECVLCSCAHRKYALALLALARKAGMVGRKLLISERTLIEVIGSKRYANILKQQIRILFSGPETRCRSCNAFLKLLVSKSQATKRMAKCGGPGYIGLTCALCGHMTPTRTSSGTGNKYDVSTVIKLCATQRTPEGRMMDADGILRE